jgi:drug/metabolite transporter (DMT)-like permease
LNGERLRVWIALVIASTVWGSTWLAIKLGLQTVPPFLAVAVRFALASLLLWAVIRIRKLPIPWTPNAKKAYLSMAFLTFTVPFALVYWGQQFVPSALGSILFAAFPFWVALFSHWMTPEKLDGSKLAGIACGFSGVVVVFGADLMVTETRALLGMGAIALSVVIQALSLVQVKQYGEEVNPFVLNFVGMLMALAAMFLLWWILESDQPVAWGTAAVLSVLYLAIVGSVTAFVAYYWLLKRIDAVYLSLTSFINPIVAVVLGAVALDERLAPSVFAGALLVFLGILVANWRQVYAKFGAEW